MLRASHVIVFLAGTIAALATTLPVAASGPATPTVVDLALALDADGHASATVHQTWSGESARTMREALDVYFGAADGILTKDELARIADATRADMIGKPLPWLTTSNEAWAIDEALITFGGAEGRTSSTSEVSMTHEIALAAPAPGEVDEITLAPPWPATLTLDLPADRRVVGEGAPTKLAAEEPTTLRIEAAPSSAGSVTPAAIAAIAASAVIVVLLLAVGAYLAFRRLRPRRGQPAR